MTSARRFAWAAFAWSAIVAGFFVYVVATGESSWFLLSLVPLAVTALGVFGTYFAPGLTWLAVLVLIVISFLPMELFWPTAVLMAIAAGAQTLAEDARKPKAPVNGGRT